VTSSDEPAGGSGNDATRAHQALVSHMRHELRTPVNAIMGYSEMLLEDLQERGDEAHERFAADLAHLAGSGRTLLAVINSALSGELVEQQGEQFDMAAAGAHLRHELRDPLSAIVGYCELLEEEAPDLGLQEMLPDLGRILKAARTLEGLIENIVGFQTPEATAVASEARAGGLADLVQEAVATAQAATEGLDETARGGRVLVVDDNEMNRDLLSRRLQREGYTVREADSGAQALRLVADHRPDLVLLDIIMPEMNGFAVLQHLKGDPALRDIPVIMISALEDMASVVQCIELGAEDYLSKPFDPVLLRARAGACVEKKHLRDQQAELHRQLQTSYDQLRELEALRDSLTHMIVHDLRTPLTSLLTGLQTLQAMSELDEFQTEMVTMSVRGGETLLGMINDLLDISKMESGSLSLERTDVDLRALAQRCLAQVEYLAREKELELELEVPAALPALEADEDKLRRTLVNLLGNSIKFTLQGAVTLAIRHEPADATICCAVRDTGEGIPQEAFEKIFEKFGQVESRKAGRKMSTGLGLTFCKMVAEAHGGRIWVESELGLGSVFTVAIPVTAPAAG
jgi:signal transduction histidine kinase